MEVNCEEAVLLGEDIYIKNMKSARREEVRATIEFYFGSTYVCNYFYILQSIFK